MFTILLGFLVRENEVERRNKRHPKQKEWGKPFLYTDKYFLCRKVYSSTKNYSNKWITWAKEIDAKFAHKSCLNFYMLTGIWKWIKIFYAIASIKILRINLTKDVKTLHEGTWMFLKGTTEIRSGIFCWVCVCISLFIGLQAGSLFASILSLLVILFLLIHMCNNSSDTDFIGVI